MSPVFEGITLHAPPFFVLYRLIDDGIEIVRVIHGSRNLSRVLE